MHQFSRPIAVPAEPSAPYARLWMACFLGYATIGMTIQVMPVYAHDRWGAGPVLSGLTVTIGSLATMLTRPFAGRIADSRGGRGVVMAGAILAMLGGFGHLLASNLSGLILARLALGAGEGALFTASIGWVLLDADPLRRGTIAGHFGLSMWSGLAAGPIIGAVLIAFGSYRDVWYAAGLFPALAWALIAGTPRVRAIAAMPTIRRALLPRASWVPGLSNVFASVGYGVIAAFLVPHFAASQWGGRDLALAAFGAVFLLARFAGSASVDRFGARRVMLISLLVEAAGLACLFGAHTTVSAFLGIALAAAGLSLLYPCLARLVTDAADPGERSAALGAMTSAWDLGLAIAGPLGGLVAGRADAGPFGLGAGAALIATVPILLAERRSQRMERCR